MSAVGKGFETAMKALESSSRLPKLVVFDLGTEMHTFDRYGSFALWPFGTASGGCGLADYTLWPFW